MTLLLQEFTRFIRRMSNRARWKMYYTECGKKSGLLKFFAIFSATVYDFNMKFLQLS